MRRLCKGGVVEREKENSLLRDFCLWSHGGVLVVVSPLQRALDLADEGQLALLVHLLLGQLVPLVLHPLVLETLQTFSVLPDLRV